MKDLRHDEFERLRQRAVEIGNTGQGVDYRELFDFLSSEFPVVRKTAASALGKYLMRDLSISSLAKVSLISAIGKETGEQTLFYMLKAVKLCAKKFNRLDIDLLSDIARNPTHKQYVREAASEAISAGDEKKLERRSILQHWCTRCQRIVTPEESARGIQKYGKPYCRHCLEERILEDANFEKDVEKAKRLRTTDEVAVQSRGEKRIGDWLAARNIRYEYDERMIVAGDRRIRPDFYLPEFDLYIEYWGMNTPEYIANMQDKKVLYQREGMKLISLSYKDLDRLEELLKEKLSRYIRL